MRPLLHWLPLHLLFALGTTTVLADDFDAPAWRRLESNAVVRAYSHAGFAPAQRLQEAAASRVGDSAQPVDPQTLTAEQRGALARLTVLRKQLAPFSPVDTSLIVARAHELIGTPYRWGGTTEEAGFDCSGLLVYLYGSIAKRQLPRTTASMIAQRRNTVSRNELRPGDAVFFNRNGSGRASHVGLYIGDGQFIHAPSSGKTIRIDSLANTYWQRSYTTARRFSG
ncbi:C40 family peptidase [Pseudomonas sp. NY15437]|uniref:C40 family peptidase n=1 Tax=unclassified Pseudomonas TaxID=196821 RepID=UPI0028832ECD|nr:C40 family peptidase [Pseudomonas sp. GCEP-101]